MRSCDRMRASASLPVTPDIESVTLPARGVVIVARQRARLIIGEALQKAGNDVTGRCRGNTPCTSEYIECGRRSRLV